MRSRSRPYRLDPARHLSRSLSLAGSGKGSRSLSTSVLRSARRVIIGALLLIYLGSSFAEGFSDGDATAMPHQASPPIDTHAQPNEGSPLDRRDQNTTDARITQLEKELRELTSQLQQAGEEPEEKDGIDIGGAVRIQYSWEDYVQGNRERGGDVDFDIFRIDFNGQLGGVLLSAQYRWFQYMDVIHHAWVGYRISDDWELQAGITRVPFGNLDFNSHNFFFSSCYYVGLEDDYDAGIKIVGKHEAHDVRVAFFKTDEMGGIDGFVDNRTDRYSYDVLGIRADGEGTFDPPATELAEYNSVALRYTYQCGWVELGGSWLAGDLRDRYASARSPLRVRRSQ